MMIGEDYNFPDFLAVYCKNDYVMFEFEDIKTNWISNDDSFVSRLTTDYLNPDSPQKHLLCELKMKNRLDEGINFLNYEKPKKAIECFDDVIYYRPDYAWGLFLKSKSLFLQKHFIKSLRYYKRAIKIDSSLKDNEYYKSLLDKSHAERENFPEIKFLIYTGDEFFSSQDYQKALDSYDKALKNPSGFKDKILHKLLNKKATALFKLNRFDEALDCFNLSIDANENDYAYYGKALTLYELNKNPKDMRFRCDLKKLYKSYIRDSLLKANKINKKQLLKKALILNELEFFRDSLKAFNEFLDVHFIGEDYEKAISGRDIALKHIY